MKYLVTISLILLLSGCITCNKDDCIQPPDPFNFKIIDKDSREDLVFSINAIYHPDSIRLFYFQGEEKIDLPLQKTTTKYEYYALSNQILPYVSSIEIIKDFYLQLNYLDTDTLLIDVRQINFECCMVFEYAQSYINGSVLKRSPTDYTVFLVEK
ncbi:hypothetical protein ES703_110266 [subsurface metagenome]